LLAAAIGAVVASTAVADSTVVKGPMAFDPIAASAYAELTADPVILNSQPWIIPQGYSQRIVSDERNLNIYVGSDWPDMNTVNETGKQAGRYMYRTHEVRPDAQNPGAYTGGAVSVVDLKTGEAKLVAGVCFAHLVSHYYMLLIAPLFVFIRTDYGVSYTELGLALTAFSAVSTVMQTPVGFFIDRTDARMNLIGGLLLGSGAIAVAGLVDSFWVFVAMFAVMGVANTVYHPADYALLSEHVRRSASPACSPSIPALP
jgi:hypothetical protein